jgi:hypothetical protein
MVLFKAPERLCINPTDLSIKADDQIMISCILIEGPIDLSTAAEVSCESCLIVLAPKLKRLKEFVLGEVQVDQVCLSHMPPDAMTMMGVAKAAMVPRIIAASSSRERNSKLSMMSPKGATGS